MSTLNLVHYEADLVAYKANDTIFKAGDAGDTMYIVREGIVEVRFGDTVFGEVGADECFGEMALVDSKPRSATAIARTDCRVLPIDQKRFLFMVHETPYFALDVMRTISERLRRMNDFKRS